MWCVRVMSGNTGNLQAVSEKNCSPFGIHINSTSSHRLSAVNLVVTDVQATYLSYDIIRLTYLWLINRERLEFRMLFPVFR